MKWKGEEKVWKQYVLEVEQIIYVCVFFFRVGFVLSSYIHTSVMSEVTLTDNILFGSKFTLYRFNW